MLKRDGTSIACTQNCCHYCLTPVDEFAKAEVKETLANQENQQQGSFGEAHGGLLPCMAPHSKKYLATTYHFHINYTFYHTRTII